MHRKESNYPRHTEVASQGGGSDRGGLLHITARPPNCTCTCCIMMVMQDGLAGVSHWTSHGLETSEPYRFTIMPYIHRSSYILCDSMYYCWCSSLIRDASDETTGFSEQRTHWMPCSVTVLSVGACIWFLARRSFNVHTIWSSSLDQWMHDVLAQPQLIFTTTRIQWKY